MWDHEEDAEAFDAAVGQKVRDLRASKGMSQADLARELAARGINFRQQMVGRLESGERPIRLKEALPLADALGVPIEFLLSDSKAEASNVWSRLHNANGELANALEDVARAAREVVAARDAFMDLMAEADAMGLPGMDAHNVRVANLSAAEVVRKIEGEGPWLQVG